MSTHAPARLRKIVKAAKQAGWAYDMTGKGHPRLTPPRGWTDRNGELQHEVTFALTPSDRGRGDKNGIANLRRAGLNI